MTAASFSIGGTEHQRVEVTVSGYERQPSGDYDDDNWLNVEVFLAVGGFRGRFVASFTTVELLAFRDELATLQASLKGEAKLVTLETQLLLILTGNDRGGISLKGEAYDQPGIGNHLHFGLDLDQTHLTTSLRELNAVIECFPVRAG
jgi:hypothetical protein